MALDKNNGTFASSISGVISGETSQVAGMNAILNNIMNNTNYNYTYKLDKGTYTGNASDLKTLIDGKKDDFIENSGFNLEKTDSYNGTSSNILVTAKALGDAYNALYNNKSDAVDSVSTTQFATSKAVNTAYEKGVSAYELAGTKFNSTGGTISGDTTISGKLTTTTLVLEGYTIEVDE